ncbi:MAG TPA: hypothetical protein ENJ80_12405 [Gammaproteobacteria bacterium]|nr:hypothetical protein [Gammaproteobacteria bacterium]
MMRLPVTLLLACAGAALAAGPAQAVNAATQTYVFVCENQTTNTVRATGAEAWVFRPGGTLRLPSVPGEAGSYSDGSFMLLIEGQTARLGAVGADPVLCRNDRRSAIWEKAKLDGADFRAVGNEPGWHLEIREQSRIVLVADYGASRVELPLPEPITDTATRTTRWDAGELVLEVTGRPCRDSMSGELFETEVRVTWQGRTLRGCGRALH